MRIAARLAGQIAPSASPDFNNQLPDARYAGFHGNNVTVCKLTESDFEAECSVTYTTGDLVRLRLPCAGMAIARIREARHGWLQADFVNPIGQRRLALTLGSKHSFS